MIAMEKFSKFGHGCSMVHYEKIQAVPYWHEYFLAQMAGNTCSTDHKNASSKFNNEFKCSLNELTMD